MFRPASRVFVRAPHVAFRPASRRLITTSTGAKSRSWKNTAVRLGLAFGAVYYYNTSTAFAEHPLLSRSQQQQLPETSDATTTQTLDSIKPRIREERAKSASAQQADTQTHTGELNPADLEEEAGQEAAFDPETGEINWDCPCLGGMAHGPCGEEFKAAFSCFVYSKEEPKGMECIDKFKGMQDCFRAHPDVYGAELEDEEEEGDEANVSAAPAGEDHSKPDEQAPATQLDASSHPEEKRSRAKEAKAQMSESHAVQTEQPEGDELLPKAWHDTEDKNNTTKAARAENKYLDR